jgi:hypothetical protein
LGNGDGRIPFGVNGLIQEGLDVMAELADMLKPIP